MTAAQTHDRACGHSKQEKREMDSLMDMMHRRGKEHCKVVAHFKKKMPAKKAACGRRNRGRKARVGGTRGNYTVVDCGPRKSRRRK